MTREEIVAATGQIPDHFVVDIIATGATPGELAEARSLARGEFLAGRDGNPSARVQQLCQILDAADEAARDPSEFEDLQ
ncbi:MAG TPA: hypothetical protein VM662_07575 [Sphingomonas sp.]|nr:hypothetical protein [Sphingomonas sp.]